MRRVLFFFPQNLYPPRSGFHRRGLEMLKVLRDIGCEVTLASSALCAYPPWQDPGVAYLKENLVSDLRIHEPTWRDRRFVSRLSGLYRLTRRVPPVNSAIKTPPGMRAWFRHVAGEVEPDVVMVTYAHWDGLVGSWARAQCRVMEAIDLVTLNRQMWEAIERCLPQAPVEPQQVPVAVLAEDFYDRLGFEPLPEEFRIYSRYNYTISLAVKEADLIRQNSTRTRALCAPMTLEPAYVENTYRDLPVFATGPNPYNVQGYLYFARRVLPRILKQCPDFRLRVTGHVCDAARPVDGITMSGFVPDLSAVYRDARFAVCPVLGGTGQQVKIVEALAHGVPVIALRAVATSSPLRHGESGLIAADAEQFAEYAIQLWQDLGLCARLGAVGREAIAAQQVNSPLLESLSVVLSGWEGRLTR